MTIVYVPRLIESAEQAEALPDGTIATRDRDWPRILLRDETGHHWASGGMAGFMYPVDMTGWTALVPIEAEEEYGAEMKWDARTPHDTHVSLGLSLDNARWQAENNPDYATGRIMRQYRTPWEEA